MTPARVGAEDRGRGQLVSARRRMASSVRSPGYLLAISGIARSRAGSRQRIACSTCFGLYSSSEMVVLGAVKGVGEAHNDGGGNAHPEDPPKPVGSVACLLVGPHAEGGVEDRRKCTVSPATGEAGSAAGEQGGDEGRVGELQERKARGPAPSRNAGHTPSLGASG